MLTKNDLDSIKGIVDTSINSSLKPVKQDMIGLKQDVSSLKNDMIGFKTDISKVKNDVMGFKTDISKVKDAVDFLKNAVISILDWTQDIHETIVVEKLPQRVKKLEQVLKTS